MTDFRSLIRDIPDFPKPGITFFDIAPVLADPDGFGSLLSQMSDMFRDQSITKVAGIEARGFTLAAPIAQMLGAGFVPIRKPGKLPYDVYRQEYSLEYGIDALEMHTDAVGEGDKVLLVDDVIATGGTAAAALTMLNQTGADVVGLSVFIELGFLNGRSALGTVPLHALLTYD